MKTSTTSIALERRNATRWTIIALLVIASALFAPVPANGQNNSDLKQQIAELQAKVKRLEAATHAQPTSSPSMPAMSPMPPDSMKMEMDDMKMSDPGMMDMMSMMGHMKMSNSSSDSSHNSRMPKSALPGFPGISHLYHIGATGFFLDHAEHISLSADQQARLNKMKEQALHAKADSDRRIERAEQDLGELTGGEQPDAAKVEKKVREIEKVRSDERLAFIKAVGEAARVLTDDQRKILVGLMQPHNMPSPSPSMSPMSHM